MPTKKFLSLAQDKNKKWFVKLKNTNGENYMATETYDSKGNAKRSMGDFEGIAVRFLLSIGYAIQKLDELEKKEEHNHEWMG